MVGGAFWKFETTGIPLSKPQATHSNVALVVPLVEQAAIQMPRLEGLGMPLEGVVASCILDMVPGYWQMPSHESAQELFNMVTTGGLYTPALRIGYCRGDSVKVGGTRAFLCREMRGVASGRYRMV